MHLGALTACAGRAGSRNLVPVLQQGKERANIFADTGAIWGSSGESRRSEMQMTFHQGSLPPKRCRARNIGSTSAGSSLPVGKQRASGSEYAGTVLFIHGSSWASLSTFDLQNVPNRPHSSVMDWFAARGFDCWCLDNEGYGRSDKHRDIQFGIETGAEDIEAATDYILKLRALKNVLLYGISAGALKSALFTQHHCERVARLALDAFVWTGKDSPTLAERRKTVARPAGGRRRPFDRKLIQSVFDRDLPGTAEQTLIDVFAEESLKWDNSVPIGTFDRRHVDEIADGGSRKDQCADYRHARPV